MHSANCFNTIFTSISGEFGVFYFNLLANALLFYMNRSPTLIIRHEIFQIHFIMMKDKKTICNAVIVWKLFILISNVY